MKTFILFICLGIIPMCLFSQIDVKNERPLMYANMKQKAADKWPGNYEIQKYTIDNQCKAYNEYSDLLNTYTIPKDVFLEILGGALDKWCENNWMKCIDDHKDNGVDEVSACYSADWEMVVYEMKNQIKAYESLK